VAIEEYHPQIIRMTGKNDLVLPYNSHTLKSIYITTSRSEVNIKGYYTTAWKYET
jgi:hypothetical protein